ncbi:MAG: YcjX family protein, partial [Thiomicrorhabdus sp.]|nr:YcjX family protein [Thiomicrorhabdus sp.]
ILIDLFEGLNHSKQNLQQLKETLSNLSQTFVYGNKNWFSKHILRQSAIGKVAFVATKSDLIPESQKPNLQALLQEITEGARSQFNAQEIEFEHFLVSAIQATDPGESPNSLRYTNTHNQYVEVLFEPLPSSIKQMQSDEHFPTLPVKVPKDYLPRILNGRGLDRLFQYLLD